MKRSDFPLILPVLTGQDVVTSGMEYLNEEEAQSDQEFTLEQLPSVLAEISSIPDGIHLLDYPGHYDGANCWCRPEIIATGTMLVINHKDLRRGEFDS